MVSFPIFFFRAKRRKSHSRSNSIYHRGLTQQELADRLSISNKTVSKWECGVSRS
ncbi:MAG: helix-turn-helix transcriptional regulator [Candidatus Fimivicinus sp.]|nr:helix-turn-helix transcriptional regulator [Candidatus Fimivicinus sp.]